MQTWNNQVYVLAFTNNDNAQSLLETVRELREISIAKEDINIDVGTIDVWEEESTI